VTTHSFVDESKRRLYLLVVASIRTANVSRVRQAISGLVLPNQRRIHFYHERDNRKSMIMSRLSELPIEATIYQAAKVDSHARSRCLTLLIRDQLKRDVRRLILERDNTQVDADRRLLHREVHMAGAAGRIIYDHLRAHEEQLLAMPDAIAWCWAQGGHWRVKAKSLVSDVIEA
jgi:hypothetical protein